MPGNAALAPDAAPPTLELPMLVLGSPAEAIAEFLQHFPVVH
jgi:hypothetical protein